MRIAPLLFALAACADAAVPAQPDAGVVSDAALGDAAALSPDAAALAPDATALAPDAATRDAAVDADAAPLAPDAAGPGPTITPLRLSRDRILGTMIDATHATRCDVWSAFDPVQRGVFLTITDLLGKRSWLTEGPPVGPRTGSDLDMALDHVERFVAVLPSLNCGSGRCCGGAGHRVFFIADARLIAALRDTNAGLPIWGSSLDLGGPHDPFTEDSETEMRQPTGQAHFFKTDAEAVELIHDGIAPITDPRLVEIDIDYNIIHDSNPVCDYSGSSGLQRWEADWSSLGAGGDAELGYVPTGC